MATKRREKISGFDRISSLELSRVTSLPLPSEIKKAIVCLSRFWFGAILWGVIVVIVPMSMSLEAADNPNVVVLLADDQGWGDLSLHGNRDIRTPNIDSIAKSGTRFHHFFVCHLCAPTRAEFLTGQYFLRNGVRGVSQGEERLNYNIPTIANYFRDAGYRTGCFGKWHNGTQAPYDPNSRGFDEFIGYTSGHWGDYYSPKLEKNGEIISTNGFLADTITDFAIDFIKREPTRPYFCYVAFNTPHSPMQVPDKYWDRYKNRELLSLAPNPAKQDIPKTRAALAMCENIDDNVGRILEILASTNQLENTIVVYFSDNGPNGIRWNGPWKGQKGSLDEGGLRSPLLISFPKKIKLGSEIQQLSGAVDLLPTLAELAEIELRSAQELDGVSLAKWCLEPTSPNLERTLISCSGQTFSARSTRFRLDAQDRLFDISHDPSQQVDISAQFSEEKQKLNDLISRFANETVIHRQKDTRPFTVGFAKVTRLPARDGTATGEIKRSAPAPNCSYFTNWTDAPSNKVTWPISVKEDSRYEIILHYCCRQQDVGGVVEIQVGDERASARIDRANDPTPFGSEHDRVVRQGESLMRDFAALSMGEIHLSQGEHKLVLTGRKLAGEYLGDFEGIELRRID